MPAHVVLNLPTKGTGALSKYDLCRAAYCPVNMVARLIQQMDVVTQLCVKRIPSLASSFKKGVCTIGATPPIVSWRQSSGYRRRTFILFFLLLVSSFFFPSASALSLSAVVWAACLSTSCCSFFFASSFSASVGSFFFSSGWLALLSSLAFAPLSLLS